jgi:hypothetical protein
MKMRHALTDYIVVGYKNALGMHGRTHTIREQTYVSRQCFQQVIRHFHPCRDMQSRDEQYVARKERMTVPERQGIARLQIPYVPFHGLQQLRRKYSLPSPCFSFEE